MFLVPRLDRFALYGLGGNLGKRADLRHVPAPESKVRDKPQVLILCSASQCPYRLLGLRWEIFDGEDELDVRDGWAVVRSDDGAVERGEGGYSFLPVDIVD